MRIRTALVEVIEDVNRSVTTLLVSLVAGVLLLAVWLGITSTQASNQTKGLVPLLQDQAVSALAIAVIGLVAWLGFRLRYRDAKLRYLRPYRRALVSTDTAADSSDGALLRAVLDHLIAVRPRRSLLVIAAADGFSEFEVTLPRWIARRGLVPVVVNVAHLETAVRIPALARESFVSRLASVTGDETRAQRVFTREADRGKIVILVVGLNHVAEAKTRAARRKIIEEKLRSCVEERLPFVATVSDELAPRISEVAAVRISRTYELAAIREGFRARLIDRGVPYGPAVAEAVRRSFDLIEPSTDPWYLELAADAVLNRMRGGQQPGQAVRDLFAAQRAYVRHLLWLRETALGHDANGTAPPAASLTRTIGAIGRLAHHRQEVTIRWRDVAPHLAAEEELSFAAAVSTLSRRGVLTLEGDMSDPELRFSHTDWLAFAGALGLGLESSMWAELLTPGVPTATIKALTAALVLHDPENTRGRSYLAILGDLKRGNLRDLSLDVITAVVLALQHNGGRLEFGNREIAGLQRAWQASTDQSRLLFVADVEPHPAIVRFFWRQVVPPLFGVNSYRLRRAICARLASMGSVTWHELEGPWHDLIASGADADLTAIARLTKTDWPRVGLPLASAAWILPSLSEQLTGDNQQSSIKMIEQIRRMITAPSEPAGEEPGWPDVGLEISLAEGFKFASVTLGAMAQRTDPPWLDEAKALLQIGRSWTSQQVLCQAIALAASGGCAFVAEHAAKGAHPFVREAVALAQRALPVASTPAVGSSPWSISTITRDIWFDDVAALEDGGFYLSAQAHRLLALSTLLIDLAEASHELAARAHFVAGRDEVTQEVMRGVRSRELALTSPSLPKCFVASSHAATMLDLECDCQFGLCGAKLRGPIGHRQISKAFARRAEVTARERPAAGRRVLFARRPLGSVWQRWEDVPTGRPDFGR